MMLSILCINPENAGKSAQTIPAHFWSLYGVMGFQSNLVFFRSFCGKSTPIYLVKIDRSVSNGAYDQMNALLVAAFRGHGWG